jgi:small GTP-binding protein
LDSPRVLFEIKEDLSTSAIAVGEVTGTGVPELTTGGRDGVIRIYNADRTGVHFTAQQNVEGSILSIVIADANNDGQMEIVVGRSVGPHDVPGKAGTLQIYRLTSANRFELLAEYPVDRFVTTVHVTDVTGDEKNKILAGGSDSTLRVFEMDTENHLREYARYQLEDMPITIGTCDVDGDEIDEIVTGNRDKTLRVFRVKDGAIEQIELMELPSPVVSIASGDILGDRKMELAVVTYDGSIRIYRNEESRLELFSILEKVKALSVRIEELNADHLDELVVATSDARIVFYNLQMAELQQLAVVNIGSKILAISVGDVNGSGRKEVLVGVSNGPLKVIEGLYTLIPRFEVGPEARAGSRLTGKFTITNVTDRAVTGISGKVYWFPKSDMDVTPQQIRFDLGPHETKTMEFQLTPNVEGTVIVRPIVLMWTDAAGQVRQVTTPETAILVQKGSAIAAPVASTPVIISQKPEFEEVEEAEESSLDSIAGTGFAKVEADEIESLTDEAASSLGTEESLRAAEQLLDRIFDESPRQIDLSALEEESAAEALAEEEPVAATVAATNESAVVAEIRARKPKPQKPGQTSDGYSYLFKTMIVGEGAVGKTALVNRFTTGQFEKDYKTTIGSQFAVKLTYISPPESEYAVGIKIQAWDVAGQARFKAVRKMYYSGAAGVILVFDVTRRRSFTELTKWVEEADESVGGRVPIVCVGNKIDLPDRAVPNDEAKQWAESQGFIYMESSAKTGEGVADMFSVLAESMWKEARRATDSRKISETKKR